jgi:hypothetical protein
MDQNTIMVLKMRQTMKNIESRFVKTHLCGVLVHGIGFYADVWIDAYHKHNSNQVITSVMHVIANVRQRKGRLPPTLQIQADNTTRENKNIYMFALCIALMGLGYFQEIQLCFRIVEHTHEDIDQRFSIISNTLKRTNIDSLKELMQLVEIRTSYKEAFVSGWHLENVRDWKPFITPHHLTGGDTLIGITFLHHMRFYMENGVPWVQHKHFNKDAWEPTEGHFCLISLPNTMEKPELAEVFSADQRELRALDEFIVYTELGEELASHRWNMLAEAVPERVSGWGQRSKEGPTILATWIGKERNGRLGDGRSTLHWRSFKEHRSGFDHGDNARSKS